VFKQGDYFSREYSETERSYRISDNNMWGLDDSKRGRRIAGDCLDGLDIGVRLDAYMDADEPNDRWQIDYCYIETYV